MTDERIVGTMTTEFNDLTAKVDNNDVLADKKHMDLKLAVKRFSSQIEDTVKMDIFNQTAVKIDDLKRSVEGEMDNIQ
jgi:hypothetical protein